MGTLGRTWTLYKQSFSILSADAEIVFFPVMSAISAILLAAGFFFPLFKSGILRDGGPKNISWEIYALMFIWYFLNYFIIIFFNSALVGCANMRLSGSDPKVRDGLRIAFQHIDKIVAWALVAATVGVILDTIREKSNKLVGRLLAGGLVLVFAITMTFARGLEKIIRIKSKLQRKPPLMDHGMSPRANVIVIANTST